MINERIKNLRKAFKLVRFTYILIGLFVGSMLAFFIALPILKAFYNYFYLNL